MSVQVEVDPRIIPHPMLLCVYVCLRTCDGEPFVVLRLDPVLGSSVAEVLSGYRPERPHAHDAWLRTVEAMGARLDRITIDHRDEKPVAIVRLARNGDVRSQMVAVDDGIALAVRARAPLFAADSLPEHWRRAPESLGGDLREIWGNGASS